MKPNIVLILADNPGFSEMGCYGGALQRSAPAPRPGVLAAESARLLRDWQERLELFPPIPIGISDPYVPTANL